MILRNLFLLGDIGFFSNQLHNIVDLIKPQLHNQNGIVLLGDNFYPDGITQSCDIKIQNFHDIFYDIDSPIYSILGNHDYLKNPVAQINHTLWEMPHFYYKKEYSNVDLFFLDTVLFNIHHGVSKEKIENIHQNNIDNLIEKQLTWFELELKKSTKKKIVFGHYPIKTNGLYKEKKEDILMYQYLYPILKKYNVLAYISGHEHNIQYINRNIDNYKLNQIIIGSSSEYRHWEKDYSTNRDMYDSLDNYYGNLIFEEDIVKIQFINNENRIVYEYKL